jgi:flagellar biosynthesis protein FlhG
MRGMLAAENRESEIWAIGGGKGGTGKSFLISSMATYLATKGKKVVLVDGDLGGANLHTFLGVEKPKGSLTDFFEKRGLLSEFIVDSGITNLGLLIGAIHSPSAGSIGHAQKQKLFRHIKKLDADYVLIDLGAGAHFNTIDTFLLADKMIVAVVPEITAIENMYYFLKSVFFRKLVLASHDMKDIFRQSWERRAEHHIANLRQLIDYLKGVSPDLEYLLNSELAHFTVHIILNQVRSSQDVKIGNALKSICIKHFGLHAQYVGYVEYDEFVPKCINKRVPYMQAYPASRCAREIEKLTDNLLEGRYVRMKI